MNGGRSVLVVSPHPDDEAIGCGGSVRSHVEDGARVRVVFLTSGEQGGHGIAPEQVGPRREQEARAAAEILGVEELEFWRLPDSRLQATAAVVQRLHDLLTTTRPDLVYAPHAQEAHPDHRAAARIVRRAAAGLGIDIHEFEVWTPLTRMDLVVDITKTIEAKMTAIRAYETQCSVMRFDDAFLGLARYRGEMFSWPEGDYAEVFTRSSP